MATGKYKDWITEDGLTIIRGWARDGYSDAQIAKNIGIARGTLYDWMERFPDISDAIKKGRAPVIVELEDALYKAGLGYEYKEVTEEITQTGEGENAVQIKHRKEVTKHIPPNAAALIFALKNRRPDKWRDKTDIYDLEYKPVKVVFDV